MWITMINDLQEIRIRHLYTWHLTFSHVFEMRRHRFPITSVSLKHGLLILEWEALSLHRSEECTLMKNLPFRSPHSHLEGSSVLEEEWCNRFQHRLHSVMSAAHRASAQAHLNHCTPTQCVDFPAPEAFLASLHFFKWRWFFLLFSRVKSCS